MLPAIQLEQGAHRLAADAGEVGFPRAEPDEKWRSKCGISSRRARKGGIVAAALAGDKQSSRK